MWKVFVKYMCVEELVSGKDYRSSWVIRYFVKNPQGLGLGPQHVHKHMYTYTQRDTHMYLYIYVYIVHIYFSITQWHQKS